MLTTVPARSEPPDAHYFCVRSEHCWRRHSGAVARQHIGRFVGATAITRSGRRFSRAALRAARVHADAVWAQCVQRMPRRDPSRWR